MLPFSAHSDPALADAALPDPALADDALVAPGARPLRVTLLLDTRAWAGTESHVLTLARSLSALGAGVEVTLACPPGSPLWERARAAGLPTLAIARRGVWDAGTLDTLVRRVRRGSCDVLHAHNGRTALWAALAIAGARRGAGAFTHHFIEPAHAQNRGPLGRAKSAVHLQMARGIGAHIAISQAVAQALRARGEVEEGRLFVVPNGINAPDAPQTPNGPEALPAALRAPIACVARLESEKGLPTLVRALAILKAQRPHDAPRCVIAGEGEQRAELEALIQGQGVRDVVHLAGFTPLVGAILEAARVCVLPASAEPFGLALVEAMSRARAVVAVDAGGPREIVVPGQTGLLVAPDDAPALARALGELLDDPDRTAALGRAGYQRFQTHFTAARMARQTLQVYRHAGA